MCGDCGCEPGAVTIDGEVAPGGARRTVEIGIDLRAKNRDLAEENRILLTRRGVFSLNLLSSPGSGKTTLLTRTLTELGSRYPMSVIEGDQQTANDAERIRATGAAAVQINTGKGCHLDAAMVGRALARLPLDEGGLIFIENVGNLVCPAGFDLGEAARVVVLSVTEGEDKPIKYPDIFHVADLVVLNKVDLLPHLDFDVGRCLDTLRQVNTSAPVIKLSATTGEGMGDWYGWIAQQRSAFGGGG